VPQAEKKKSRSKSKVVEIIGVDLAGSGVKLARVKASRDKPVVTALGLLPPIETELFDKDGEQVLEVPEKLPLSKAWTTYYAALAVSGRNAVIRYVTLPGHVENSPNLSVQLREHMGLEGDYRLSYSVMPEMKKKAETRLLAAALPSDDAERIMSMVDVGFPAPMSLEVSCLSSMNVFSLYGPLLEHEEDAVGFIETGYYVSMLALFNKGQITLVRKFNTGSERLVARVQKQMQVDRETAEHIISDGSFDISQAVQEVMDPFLRQIAISKEFVERREGAPLSRVYMSGGMALSRFCCERVAHTVGLPVHPWHALLACDLTDDAIPPELSGQEMRFSAAVGAAVGALESS
jgi:Tfp pilus assembly PilM family ATPase